MTLLAVFGGIVGLGIVLVLGSVLNGYALSVLWGWFVVPTFGGPTLGVVPAIGIAMVVSYLTHQIPDNNKKEEGDPIEKIIRGIAITILQPLFALLFGWIVHLFM